MSDNGRKARFLLLPMLVLLLSVGPVFCASAVVGSVAGGTNATVGERPLVPNTTLFSGDSLQIKDGSAVVALQRGSLVVFGRETLASLDRDADRVTVALTRGTVSMYHPADGVPVRVKVGQVSILSGNGFKTQGDVAMVNGIVVVTAKEGSLVVEGAGRAVEVKKGKSVAIKNPMGRAPSGQAGAAGGAHIGSSLAVPIALAAVAGVGATFSIITLSKANDANDAASLAATNAASADADAKAATAAANQADADAKAALSAAQAAATAANDACHAVSPADPHCH